MKKDEITFAEFTERLTRLDWYYMMSDDRDAYQLGRDSIAYYRSIAEENGPEWTEAFETERKKRRI